jgi:hypothetical protein
VLTRRSTTDYTVFTAGGPISWQSKLQPTVATSSLESEYMVCKNSFGSGGDEELTYEIIVPTAFLVDSQSARNLTENPVFIIDQSTQITNNTGSESM